MILQALSHSVCRLSLVLPVELTQPEEQLIHRPSFSLSHHCQHPYLWLPQKKAYLFPVRLGPSLGPFPPTLPTPFPFPNTISWLGILPFPARPITTEWCDANEWSLSQRIEWSWTWNDCGGIDISCFVGLEDLTAGAPVPPKQIVVWPGGGGKSNGFSSGLVRLCLLLGFHDMALSTVPKTHCLISLLLALGQFTNHKNSNPYQWSGQLKQ